MSDIMYTNVCFEFEAERPEIGRHTKGAFNPMYNRTENHNSCCVSRRLVDVGICIIFQRSGQSDVITSTMYESLPPQCTTNSMSKEGNV